ncbi:hypothetical protein SAMN04489723_10127 [Algoriphagus aquimarinus]|uniref:Uncharacterized protein n=1 Tax=Algoriphagus aquimarinus TaxID=237018 RepID=A0A1I0V819_9BACT|nr:hypothetical protein SAMN04489723_10127 [Algoriphagus aquimarinus]
MIKADAYLLHLPFLMYVVSTYQLIGPFPKYFSAIGK